MATKKKSPSKGRTKVSKLKAKGEKVQELTDKDAKRVRGGVDDQKLNRLTRFK